MVIKGYRIPFARKPPLKKLSRENIWRYQTQVSQDMDIEIQRLLKDKALRRSYQKSGFLSTMFLKKKSNGEIRPMFNLKNLNQYLSIPKFHLINHFQIPLHLRRNDFMMKTEHLAGLFSYLSKPRTPPISVPFISGNSLRNDLLTIRVSKWPINICKSYKLDATPAETERHCKGNPCIPRRFSHISRGPDYSRRSSSHRAF